MAGRHAGPAPGWLEARRVSQERSSSILLTKAHLQRACHERGDPGSLLARAPEPLAIRQNVSQSRQIGFTFDRDSQSETGPQPGRNNGITDSA
jgi:hypothetical protein